jgi:hypothetical protein
MNDPQTPDHSALNESPEAASSALFAHLVMQQSNMAMMLLGKTPHPETGQVVRDLDAARFFIDQLEMLEAKTKGNLNPEEAALLKQTLMALRMAFVESVERPPTSAPPRPESAAPPAGTASTADSAATAAPPASPAEEEPRKKFTKKY